MPSIGVVIPCHSYPSLLWEALTSLYEQTVPPSEIGCIIDLEPDEQYAHYKGGLANAPEHVWHCGIGGNAPRGVSNARNVGFEEFRRLGYEWVIPLDEDDALRPRYIERMMEAAALCPHIDIWYTDWVEFGLLQRHHRCPEYSYETLLKQPFIVSCAMIRTSVWEAVKAKNGTGYDVELTDLGLRWEDYLFYLEAGALGFQMARVGLPLVRVRRHGVSGTTVANQTIPQWLEYAQEKLDRLYGVALGKANKGRKGPFPTSTGKRS